MITGKNKEQFEKWYGKLDNPYWNLMFKKYYPKSSPDYVKIYFKQLPFEMQIGVYEDYYDSLGMDICVEKATSLRYDDRCYTGKYDLFVYDEMGNGINNDCKQYNSRKEAYKEAFKKADEIINSKLN